MIDSTKFEETGRKAQDHWERISLPAIRWLVACPCPAWLKRWDSKRGEFVMRWINPAYTEKYGITPEEYQDKPDSEVWSDEIAKRFTSHDKESSHRSLIFVEKAPTPDNPSAAATYAKFPVWIDGVLHVGGIELRHA